jgi:septum site-determining protein MinC
MIPEKNALIQIKGIRDGLLVTLQDGAWPELQEALLKQIQEQAGFFKGARLALDVGNQILHAAELGGLRDKLSDQGVGLWAVLSNSPTTEQTAQVLGLATKIFAPRPEKANKLPPHSSEGQAALFVQKTLRSGMRVVYPGSVVVIGDVNPGAEIICEGSVVIWGRLKGMVHAGSEGNEKAAVYALELSPIQLRIANCVASPLQHRRKPAPEVALIENGQVVAKFWEAKENIR